MADEKLQRLSISIPSGIWARIRDLAEERGTSAADVARDLITRGLKDGETIDDIFARCLAATETGKSAGWIYSHVLDGHPNVAEVRITQDLLQFRTKAGGGAVLDVPLRQWSRLDLDDQGWR